MNIENFSKPDMLEQNSFLWSEARLAIAAIALLLGGVPPLRLLLPIAGLYGLISTVLTLAWIVSGVASVYLLYRWFTGGKVLFGAHEPLDMAAFLVSAISGINLGFTGLTGNNLGMSIFSGRVLFGITALVYLASAAYLWRRWSISGKKIF
jgi:uncharacterized membrane protein YuzA (DUF378 family)